MNQHLIPGSEKRIELTIKKSVFIASAGPALTINEAKDFIVKIKDEFMDASHNVPAFIVSQGSSIIEHCSDDGEPSGTAGKPILAVLKGSGIKDIVLVVTRYFGGIKLGTGGLVRAYTECSQNVLTSIPLAEKIDVHTVNIVIPYTYYDHVKRLISQYRGSILEEIFLETITMTVKFDIRYYQNFNSSLTEISRGKLSCHIIDTGIDFKRV